MRSLILWATRPLAANQSPFVLVGLAGGSAYAVFVSSVDNQSETTLMMAAIFGAALTSSIAGFAFSAICGAMLFHLDPNHVEVVQIMLICSIGIQALSVWTLRHSID